MENLLNNLLENKLVVIVVLCIVFYLLFFYNREKMNNTAKNSSLYGPMYLVQQGKYEGEIYGEKIPIDPQTMDATMFKKSLGPFVKDCNKDNECGGIEIDIGASGMNAYKKKVSNNMNVFAQPITPESPRTFISLTKLNNQQKHRIGNIDFNIPNHELCALKCYESDNCRAKLGKTKNYYEYDTEFGAACNLI